jgi:hypothetical protein
VARTASLTQVLQRVVDRDEELAARFPQLGLAVHTAVATGRPFDAPRQELHRTVARNLRLHADLDAHFAARPNDIPPAAAALADAAAAQHRALSARLDELLRAGTGLDAVALTRTLQALLTIHRDLEHRLQGSLREPMPAG